MDPIELTPKGLTPKQLSEHLGVSLFTVRSWIFNRRILSIKLQNGRVIIPYPEIERIKALARTSIKVRERLELPPLEEENIFE